MLKQTTATECLSSFWFRIHARKLKKVCRGVGGQAFGRLRWSWVQFFCFLSCFLLVGTLVPSAHTKGLDWVPGSWLWSVLHVAGTRIWNLGSATVLGLEPRFCARECGVPSWHLNHCAKNTYSLLYLLFCKFRNLNFCLWGKLWSLQEFFKI